jgi:alkanesulfonate monooxygenase SsuD/methylene tetrahydromethanopterin reductase-like flavin-dependent oxidoreductase (luciferase family)
MEIGLGLDASLGLSFEDQVRLAREAAELGYTSLWTPEGSGLDAFQLCLLRWQGSREVEPAGLTTGIGVAPIAYRTPVAFASSAGTLGALTGGRFILGIGSGGIYRPATRRALGFRTASALAATRDYLVTVRALLAGETLDYEGEAVTLHDARLQIEPPPHVPVYLAALGPEMLRLGGEQADGIVLNWCSAEQRAWSRERVAEGAARTGRDPNEVHMAEYIRVCVDDDAELARQQFARSTLGYMLGQQVPTERERAFGYRAHFERMGFTEELANLDRMRLEGAEQDDLIEAFPDELLRRVGYFGTPEGAAAGLAEVGAGLDTAIVRVVAARPGLDSVRAVMEACRPGLVPA